MGRVNLLAALQVGDGAGHLQHPAIGPGGEAEAVKGTAQQLGSGLGGLAHLLQVPGGDVRVAGVRLALKALILALPGGVDPLADLGGGFFLPGGGELLKGHGGHFDVQVDAV